MGEGITAAATIAGVDRPDLADFRPLDALRTDGNGAGMAPALSGLERGGERETGRGRPGETVRSQVIRLARPP